MRSIYVSHFSLPTCLYITPTEFSYSNIAHIPYRACNTDSCHPYLATNLRLCDLLQPIHQYINVIIVVILCSLLTLISIVIEPVAYLAPHPSFPFALLLCWFRNLIHQTLLAHIGFWVTLFLSCCPWGAVAQCFIRSIFIGSNMPMSPQPRRPWETVLPSSWMR